MTLYNEILMLPPEEHEKRRLKRKEDREQLVKGIVDGFVKKFHNFPNPDFKFKIKIPIDDSTGFEVFNIIHKGSAWEWKKKSIVVPAVTLDSNVIQEHWKQRPKSAIVRKLIEFARDRQLDLCVTARIREDVPRKPLSDKINELPELGVREIGSIIRISCWRPGFDTPGSTKFQEVVDSLPDDLIELNRKRPDWRDWDHLHTHYLSERDIFLTWDKGILDVAHYLKNELGIVIMKPEDYLQQCNWQIASKSYKYGSNDRTC